MTREYLSEDILEEDFLKTFTVINRFQFLMGSCRLYAKSRFITPPTAKQKCYTVFCIIMALISNCVLFHVLITRWKDPVILCLTMISVIIMCAAYILNVIHARFFNANENVAFYVKLQKIDRLLKIDKCVLLNTWVRRLINVPLAVSVILCSVIMVLFCTEQKLKCLPLLGTGYAMFCILIEITLCSTLLSHFVLRICFVNCLMQNHLGPGKVLKPKVRFFSRAYIRHFAQETQNYYETSETHVFLKEIFNCFAMYQNTHRFQIFIFCLQSVISFLITFELTLYSIQTNQYSVIELCAFMMLTVLDILAAIFLGYRYELFFVEVQKTKRLCIDVMALHLEGPLREKARKMLKMIEETPPRFSVYEMWEMNAGTIVTMFSLVTSFVVTLLQFAFL